MAAIQVGACVSVVGNDDVLYQVMSVKNMKAGSTAKVQELNEEGIPGGMQFTFRLQDLKIVDFLAEKQKRAAAAKAAEPEQAPEPQPEAEHA